MSADSIARLITRIRRSALAARTLAVTLESSLATLHEIPAMSLDERSQARRRWIGQVRADLQLVERASREHRRLVEQISTRERPLDVGVRARLDAELAHADAQVHAARLQLRRAAGED